MFRIIPLHDGMTDGAKAFCNCFSCFLYFARRFWNHTCKEIRKINEKSCGNLTIWEELSTKYWLSIASFTQYQHCNLDRIKINNMTSSNYCGLRSKLQFGPYQVWIVIIVEPSAREEDIHCHVCAGYVTQKIRWIKSIGEWGGFLISPPDFD